MPSARPQLVLVYETEAACRARLLQQGILAEHADEIASYLVQSTEIAPEFGAIERACARRGLGFIPVDLDEAIHSIAECDPKHTLVWTLTDGVAFFGGSAGPALARLRGCPILGSEFALFALAQDKFRSGAVLEALGAPVAPGGLARDGQWLVKPPASPTGYFVKPNRLGGKVGIWPQSRCGTLDQALALSQRIAAAYGDMAIVQPYVAGRNVRVSFLAIDPAAGPEALGVFFVESQGDFQTMAEGLSLLGRGEPSSPLQLIEVAASQPGADRAIRALVARLIQALGLCDVFSFDFRVEADDTVHLIEFEVCPGLPSADFRTYCRAQWGLELAEAMAETAARRLRCDPA